MSSISSQDAPKSPMSPTSPTSPRFTGFPEPFNGDRNTTLPHPDADTSPNACIYAENIPVHRTLSRSKRSWKHKRTTSYGVLSAEELAMYDDAPNADMASISETDGDTHAGSPVLGTTMTKTSMQNGNTPGQLHTPAGLSPSPSSQQLSPSGKKEHKRRRSLLGKIF